MKVDGWEADDVIASLVQRARDADIPVMVVSGDRDVYQVVGDGVRVMTTSRGVTDTKIYDRDGVVERYGVPPELVPDLIGLKGDTSDNIPGVPGIGDKTAAQLLQQFGSLEAVLDSVDEISGAKRKQNLTEHADDARISKQLATLNYDIDVPIDVSKEARTPPDRSRLRDVAAEFELRAVMQRLDDEFSEDVPDRAVEETIDVEAEEGTPADLAGGSGRHVHRRGTVGRDRRRSRGGGRLRRSRGPRRADSQTPADLPRRQVAGRRWPHRARGGRARRHPRPRPRHDGRRVPDRPGTAHLRPLRARGRCRPRRGERGGRRERGEDPAESEQLSLAAEGEPTADPADEARLAFELAARQREQIERFGLERVLNEVEMPLIEVLAAMERVGLKLDTKRLAEIGEGMAERIDELERDIYDLAGHEFTIGSPQQLGEVLFDELGADQEAARQDRLLDRRARARPDPRRARDRRQGRELA